MGSLRETSTGKTCPLEPEHVIGRGFTCALRLDPGYVSAQHALLRWTGQHWDLRDLGSANGTFLDGRRVGVGEEYALYLGSRVAFGDLQAEWEVVDDSAPCAMVVPLDSGEPLVVRGDLLALPSAEDPSTTLYRGAGGSWLLEQPDQAPIPLRNLQVFQSAGRSWRFCCAENMCATTRFSPAPLAMQVRHLHLSFAVSLDEEHVEVTMNCAGRCVEMGERAHNYLFVTLARKRIDDTRDGLPETSCGWMDQEDLLRDPRMTPSQISVDVFRIRKQLSDHGVVDAASVIERRPGQLRVGTGKIAVARH
jgi:FHA domain-containing protein